MLLAYWGKGGWVDKKDNKVWHKGGEKVLSLTPAKMLFQKSQVVAPSKKYILYRKYMHILENMKAKIRIKVQLDSAQRLSLFWV